MPTPPGLTSIDTTIEDVIPDSEPSPPHDYDWADEVLESMPAPMSSSLPHTQPAAASAPSVAPASDTVSAASVHPASASAAAMPAAAAPPPVNPPDPRLGHPTLSLDLGPSTLTEGVELTRRPPVGPCPERTQHFPNVSLLTGPAHIVPEERTLPARSYVDTALDLDTMAGYIPLFPALLAFHTFKPLNPRGVRTRSIPQSCKLTRLRPLGGQHIIGSFGFITTGAKRQKVESRDASHMGPSAFIGVTEQINSALYLATTHMDILPGSQDFSTLFTLFRAMFSTGVHRNITCCFVCNATWKLDNYVYMKSPPDGISSSTWLFKAYCLFCNANHHVSQSCMFQING